MKRNDVMLMWYIFPLNSRFIPSIDINLPDVRGWLYLVTCTVSCVTSPSSTPPPILAFAKQTCSTFDSASTLSNRPSWRIVSGHRGTLLSNQSSIVSHCLDVITCELLKISILHLDVRKERINDKFRTYGLRECEFNRASRTCLEIIRHPSSACSVSR